MKERERGGTGHSCGQGDHFLPAACSGCFCQCYISQHYTAEHRHHCYQCQTGEGGVWGVHVHEPQTLDTLSQCGNTYNTHHTTTFSLSTEQVFRVKNSWGCRPNSNYLLTQSQVRYMTICSNLPMHKTLACTYFTHARAHRHEQTVQLFLSFLCSFGAALNNPAIHT